MSKFEYRIIKSSWGIAIDITGKHSIFKNVPKVGNQVSDKIWLDLQNVSIALNKIEKNLIENALNFVAEKITSKVGESNYVLIEITNINFNPCDYQSEGLFCAVMEWAGKEFDFVVPHIDVEFNKKNNKYNFFIDELLIKN